jgi:hypothetical protein
VAASFVLGSPRRENPAGGRQNRPIAWTLGQWIAVGALELGEVEEELYAAAETARSPMMASISAGPTKGQLRRAVGDRRSVGRDMLRAATQEKRKVAALFVDVEVGK